MLEPALDLWGRAASAPHDVRLEVSWMPVQLLGAEGADDSCALAASSHVDPHWVLHRVRQTNQKVCKLRCTTLSGVGAPQGGRGQPGWVGGQTQGRGPTAHEGRKRLPASAWNGRAHKRRGRQLKKGARVALRTCHNEYS